MVKLTLVLFLVNPTHNSPNDGAIWILSKHVHHYDEYTFWEIIPSSRYYFSYVTNIVSVYHIRTAHSLPIPETALFNRFNAVLVFTQEYSRTTGFRRADCRFYSTLKSWETLLPWIHRCYLYCLMSERKCEISTLKLYSWRYQSQTIPACELWCPLQSERWCWRITPLSCVIGLNDNTTSRSNTLISTDRTAVSVQNALSINSPQQLSLE